MKLLACSSRLNRGLTLVEILVAAAVLALLAGAMLGGLAQSRNLTEGSIYQNTANVIMQGYVEQIKNMEFTDLPYITAAGTLMPGPVPGAPSTLMTRGVARVGTGAARENVPDPLLISTATTLPTPQALLYTGTPVGVVDNVKIFDINNTPNNPADDLRLRIWIWIQDMSAPAVDATQVRGITILYSWRPNNDSTRSRAFVGTVRTIRSAVPSF